MSRLVRAFPIFLTAALLPAAVLAQSFTTLRQAGDYAGIRMGTAVQAAFLTDPTYTATLAANYTQMQAEYEMKFDPIEATQNVFSWGPGDTIAAFGKQNGMAFRGHTLLWYMAVPQWVTSGNFTPQQLSAIVQNHISQVVGHYAGEVYAWDVVNEAFDDNGDGQLRSSTWYNQPGIGLSGTGYIEQAFRWARAADPNALLFYNDYSIEDLGPKADAVYAMVKDFKSRGVPIDGVGFQMHIDLSGYPSVSGFASNLARFTALGVQVQITEMDVRVPVVNGVAAPSDLQAQAQTYAAILNVCLANPNCTAFQTWGFTDLHSWIPGTFPGYGAALPFDQNYVPKPAFTSILNALTSSAPRFSAAGVVNSASYAGGSVAPGELIAVFGGALGPVTLSSLQLDSSGKVSTANAGVSVAFDGHPAPIVYTLDQQLAVFVPYEIAGQATTQMTVTNNGLSASATLNVAAAVPGLFTSNASGTGNVAALNSDFSVNSASNPALHGSYVAIYGTGDGIESGAYGDGVLVSSSNLPKTQQKVSATINGETATVVYSGGAPGLAAGVLQVNLQVPSDLAPGQYPVVITVGNASSQANALLSVK